MASRWGRDAGIACVAAGIGAGMHAYFIQDDDSAATIITEVGPEPSPEEAVASTGPCSLSVHEEEKTSPGSPSLFRFSVSPGRRRCGEASTSPMLPLAIIRPNDNLEIAFDTATRNPIYVLETFSRNDVKRSRPPSGPSTTKRDPFDGTSTSRNRFHEESGLPWNFRSRNSHYRRSGYDRGHLAPAADFPQQNRHDDNRDDDSSDDEDRVRDTYNLCNVSPQVSSFNRGPWANLERVVRSIVREELDDDSAAQGGEVGRTAIVITGPLFLPSAIIRSMDGDGLQINDKFSFAHFAIGRPPTLVTVPTHFFKVVAIADEGRGVCGGARLRKVAAFVLPNVEDESPERPPLTGYLVKLSDLETVTGMEFFPGMWGSNVEKVGGTDDNEWENFGKDFADALTEDIRDRSGAKNRDVGTPVLLNSSSLGNRKMRKIQKCIKEDEAVRLQHLCEGGRCNR